MSTEVETVIKSEEFDSQNIKRRMLSVPEGDIKKLKLAPELLEKGEDGVDCRLTSSPSSTTTNNNNQADAINLNSLPSGGNMENTKNEMGNGRSNANSEEQASSCVVHIRNLPNELSDTELIRFGLRFGKLVNFLVLVGKGQAFIEYSDTETAKVALDAASLPVPLTLKGRQLFLQYSKHKHLQTNLPNQSLINSVSEVIGGNVGSNLEIHEDAAHDQYGLTPQMGSTVSVAATCSVLRVIVENLVYMVPLETYYELFSRYGTVTKIVIFQKEGAFHTLIQFAQPSCAAAARNALNGQQMFPNGNCLRIDYSNLPNLKVKYNNEKSRDFTNSDLPSRALNSIGSISMAPSAQGGMPYFNLSGSLPFNGMRNSMGTASSPQNAALGMYGGPGAGNYSQVLLVVNLCEQLANPDALFILFGVYGDVQRVKILFNKTDSALVQMADPAQAQQVVTYLDRRRIGGKALRISMSKYNTVHMPKEGQPDSGLTKDFTNSPLHRFKKPGSKNFQNIFPPSATLHLSNIPPSCTEDQLRQAFTQNAAVNVVSFKFFSNDKKMALVQLPNVEDAILALVKMHNYQLSDSNHLRVSFSRFSI